MKPPWHRTALLAVGFLTASQCAYPQTEFCTSDEFRKAFLAGQQGIIIDYTNPSPRLVAYGNTIVPCLQAIAEDGGSVFGIEGCLKNSRECRTWALSTLKAIATPTARNYLLTYAKATDDDYLRRAAIGALGSLRDRAARSYLLELLDHDDPELRAASIVALGAIGDSEDFQPMLQAALTLPNEELHLGIHGLRIMGNPTAIERLDSRIQQIEDEQQRKARGRTLQAWRDWNLKQQQILTTLDSGSGEELYKAMRDAAGSQLAFTPATLEQVKAALRTFLEHDEPRTQTEAIITLGKLHSSSDFDILLRTTLALPETYVPYAAEGLTFLNDPRAIKPLEDQAAGMTHRGAQAHLRGMIERLRRSTGQ